MPPRPRKRFRTSATTSTPGPTIPHEIVLEIVARSDFTAIVRSAASCRPLRRDIVRPAFVRRVFHGPGGGGVPRRVLAFLHAYDEARVGPPPAALSLAHPATPAAAHFLDKNLAPFVSRDAAASGGLLGDYEPLTSRNGLVVLRRRYVCRRRRRRDLCVYNPMTGVRVFLPVPPDMDIVRASGYGVSSTYVLLTAADGAGGSFLLLAADFAGLKEHSDRFLVQTFSPDDAGGGKWGAVTAARHPRSAGCDLLPLSGAVVLGGLIHWLMQTFDFEVYGFEFHVLTYDVGTAAAGSVELPAEALPDNCVASSLHLAPSPDGRLSLLVADRLTVSVWLLAGGGWSRHAMVDTAGMLAPSLPPEWPQWWWRAGAIRLAASSGARSGAILLRPFTGWYDDLEKESGEGLAVLDVEKEEMRVVNRRNHTMNFPYEVDLELQLSAMKIF
ncbi:hypothetical protein ACP4OV_007645 [Aristida adscensionis]